MSFLLVTDPGAAIPSNVIALGLPTPDVIFPASVIKRSNASLVVLLIVIVSVVLFNDILLPAESVLNSKVAPVFCLNKLSPELVASATVIVSSSARLVKLALTF